MWNAECGMIGGWRVESGEWGTMLEEFHVCCVRKWSRGEQS